MEQSNFYQLKDGRYIMDEELSRVYSILIAEKPHRHKQNDIAMGELFARCFSDKTRFCPEAKDWFIFDGSKWKRDTGALFVSEQLKSLVNLLHIYCNELSDESDEITKQYKKYISQISDRRARERIIRDAQGECRISISDFDNDPYLINCANGTINLKTGKFHFHKADDFLTMITDCNYPLESQIIDGSRWDRFIDEITCGDKKIAKYLQRALGYSLIGKANEECMFIAYGKSTRNGKGTLFNTVHKILGDYAKAMLIDFICTNGGGSGSYDRANPMLASLKGARFITLSESDTAGKLDEATIKNYTGCDPITTRNLHERAFTFTPQFKMWLMCNSLPAVHDKSIFSSDRIRVIEFNRHFSEEERDTSLKEQFLREEMRSYIFKWLLDGCADYLKKGLREPAAVKESVKMYEKKNDNIGMFLQEMCEKDESARVNRSELYSSYKSWLRSNGLPNCPAPRFNEYIENHATLRIIRGIYVWDGIRIKNLSNIKLTEG